MKMQIGRAQYRKRGVVALAVLLTAFCFVPLEDGPVLRAAPLSKLIQKSHVGNELIVRFNPGVSLAEARAVLSHHGMTIIKSYKRISNLYHVRLPSVLSVEAAIEILESEPDVQYAEPNYTVEFDSACFAPCTPNDAEFQSPDNWGFANIGAPEAWTVTTGDPGVVVAVLDSGIDYTHPDLAQNKWINSVEESGVAGIDDDGDGYVDDVYGYNAVAVIDSGGLCPSPASSDPIDDDQSAHGHGTRLAGIIGAVGNNGVGIAGLNWNIKLMPIKIRCEPNRESSLALVLAGFDYLITKKDQGVNIKIGHMSFGVSDWTQALQDGIDAVRDAGILLVASAGNSGVDVDANPDDFHLVYDNVLFVGAINPLSALADFSSYGQMGIQLAAPGVGILSTVRSVYDPQYEADNGTSYAAPFVTGVAALLAALDPTITFSQMKARIISATTRTVGLIGKVASGGRLNAAGVFVPPITDLTPAGYQLARIEANHKYYLDRSYPVADIPTGFDGLWWVRTRNDDKENAEENYIHLGLGQPAIVYVAFDSRVEQEPNWLQTSQDWTDTGRVITVTINGNADTLKIYSRPFNPGPVTLGGAVAAGYVGPDPGQNSNYVVLIRSSTGNADQTTPSANRLDGYDLVAFNLAMGSSESSANWCAACDLDGSGTIDAIDVTLFMDNFGKSL